MRHFYLFILVLALYAPKISAQTTINTTVGSSNYTGGTNSGTGAWMTFAIINNSGGPIILNTVSNWTTTAHNGTTSALYYSTTSLSGLPSSTTTLATPPWNLIKSGTVSGITATGVNTVLTNVNFIIPNGATWRFALTTTGTNWYSSTSATPNSFTAAGVTLAVGNYQINGMNVGYGYTNNPRYFTGAINFQPACSAPGGLLVSNVDNNSADVSWNTVAGSLGYEYVLSQSATPPSGAGTATTANTHSFNNLANGTTYYFHIRNKCATSFSGWTTQSFTTWGCNRPTNVLISNVTDTSADVVWSLMPGADHYEYALNFSKQPPVSGIIQTNSHAHHFVDLQANSKYYLHIRSRCFGTDSSTWRVDSFITLMACYAPNVQVNQLGTNKPYAFWDPVPTAYAYEYKLSNSTLVPAFGTPTSATNAQLTLEDNGEQYYMFVRSQ